MRQKEFQAVARQLLPDLPGWKLKGPLLIWPPVDHTLRGVCFEPSGFDRIGFYLTVFLLPLCVRRQFLSFNIGERLGFSWESDDPLLVSKLLQALREEAIPYLEDLDTPQDVIAAIRARRGRSENPHPHRGLAYLLALYGEVREAVKVIDGLLDLMAAQERVFPVPWRAEIAEEVRMVKAKLLEDPEEARRMLREWEEESRRNLKLEEFTSAALAAGKSRKQATNTERLRRRAGKEGV